MQSHPTTRCGSTPRRRLYGPWNVVWRAGGRQSKASDMLRAWRRVVGVP